MKKGEFFRERENRYRAENTIQKEKIRRNRIPFRSGKISKKCYICGKISDRITEVYFYAAGRREQLLIMRSDIC